MQGILNPLTSAWVLRLSKGNRVVGLLRQLAPCRITARSASACGVVALLVAFRQALLGIPSASPAAAPSEQSRAWERPSPEESPFKAHPARTLFTDSLLTENGRFLILYSTSGEDAVPPADENGDTTPDFVQAVAEALERTYAVEVDTLGFAPPPNTEPWARPYRVYIRDLGTTRGVTIAEGRDPEAPVQHHLSSYIELDNDFVSPQEHLSVADAIRATAAHEFFHAIQLGYVSRLITVDGFFAELTALWMEEQVFPSLGDYRHYLHDFFSAPDIPLNAVSLTVPRIINHMYGASLFAFFLEERFGRGVIRQIWQRMIDEPGLEAIHSVCLAAAASKRSLPAFPYGTISPAREPWRDLVTGMPQLCLK